MKIEPVKDLFHIVGQMMDEGDTSSDFWKGAGLLLRTLSIEAVTTDPKPLFLFSCLLAGYGNEHGLKFEEVRSLLGPECYSIWAGALGFMQVVGTEKTPGCDAKCETCIAVVFQLYFSHSSEVLC